MLPRLEAVDVHVDDRRPLRQVQCREMPTILDVEPFESIVPTVHEIRWESPPPSFRVPAGDRPSRQSRAASLCCCSASSLFPALRPTIDFVDARTSRIVATLSFV